MKKGFTLIELLAVIVILAIIALIATPRIMGAVENARKESFRNSAYGLIKAAEKSCALMIMNDDGDIESVIYNFSEDDYDNLDFLGEVPKGGTIEVDENCKVSISFHNEKWCAQKNIYTQEVSLIDYEGEGCELQDPISGDVCFSFHADTGTITRYDFDNPECSTDVVIPSQINGTTVEHIGPAALSHPITQYCYDDEWDEFELPIDYLSVEGDGLQGCWFDYDWEGEPGPITSVVIPETVLSIGDSAFYWGRLTSVEFPDSVTSLGEWSFNDNQISNVVFGSGLTAIPNSSFSYNELTNLVIPNNITSIGSTAFNFNQLTSVTFHNDLESIGGSAFLSNNLIEVDIPSNVTLGNSVFMMNEISSVNFPEGITSIPNNLFWENQLTSITIPDSVTSIGSAAFRNNQLTEIFIPNSVTNLGGEAFSVNYILQGNALIDNSIGNVTYSENTFANNGADGTVTITPDFLR